MVTIIYGISNCDTIKKTLQWFKANDVAFVFYDYKKQGITREKLATWTNQVEWSTLINRTGTTFKKLFEAQKVAICDRESAIELMFENPSCIKRPVIEKGGQIIKIGWKPEGL